MTPREKFSSSLTDSEMLHEIAHQIVGGKVGITSGSIFVGDPGGRNLAVAWCDRNENISREAKLMRCLAGLAAQIIYRPESLKLIFNPSLSYDEIFSPLGSLCDINNVPEIVLCEGWGDDWREAVQLAEGDEDTLRGCLSKLKECLDSEQVMREMLVLLSDFQLWYDAEDEDLIYSKFAIYSEVRWKAVLEKFRSSP